jgi:hypothetical protein
LFPCFENVDCELFGGMVFHIIVSLSPRHLVHGLEASVSVSWNSNRCYPYLTSSSRHRHENHTGISAHWQLRQFTLTLVAAQISFRSPLRTMNCYTDSNIFQLDSRHDGNGGFMFPAGETRSPCMDNRQPALAGLAGQNPSAAGKCKIGLHREVAKSEGRP